jgi:hypothetical protein
VTNEFSLSLPYGPLLIGNSGLFSSAGKGVEGLYLLTQKSLSAFGSSFFGSSCLSQLLGILACFTRSASADFSTFRALIASAH